MTWHHCHDAETPRLHDEFGTSRLRPRTTADHSWTTCFNKLWWMFLWAKEDWHCAQCLLAVCKLEPGETRLKYWWKYFSWIGKTKSIIEYGWIWMILNQDIFRIPDFWILIVDVVLCAPRHETPDQTASDVVFVLQYSSSMWLQNVRSVKDIERSGF